MFRLLDQEGRTVGLTDALEKNGLLLLFFSSDWLRGDLRLLTACIQVYPRIREAGLSLLAVTGVNWEKIHHLANHLKAPFPLLFDPCCRFSSQYDAMWIPKLVTGRLLYRVDASGKIVWARKNPTPQVISSLPVAPEVSSPPHLGKKKPAKNSG